MLMPPCSNAVWSSRRDKPLTNAVSPVAASATAPDTGNWREMGEKGNSSASGGGFRGRMEYYLNSGDKKHVFAGLVIITVVFGAPWYFMTRGTKQQSHQDYLEKARSERLSSTGPAKR